MERKYLRPTILYQEAKRRLVELQTVQKNLEKRLKAYPEGKLHIVKSKSRTQYYLRTESNEKSGTYLQKKEEKKIRTFLQKKYDEDTIKQVRLEIKNLETFLKKSNFNIQKNYSKYSPEIKKYINPIDISDEDYIQEWMSEPYTHKTVSQDVPVYLTNNGERVRSKSELNIANMLQKMKISYKYECPLILANGKIIHPDFTVLDVHRRREVYWEHRGMMDDRIYLKHAVQRVKEYRKNGIYPGDNLLLTEETSTIPLGTDEIEDVIKHFLVSSTT